MKAFIHDERMKVLIVIPARNEELRISQLMALMSQWKEDTLVVDDGSDDDTAGVVRNLGFLCISHPENRGLSGVYLTATRHALANQYTHLLSLDADGQHDPAFIPAFLGALENHDFVSGNRFRTTARVPDAKLASNLFAILLFREVTGASLPDVSCGYRGWKISAFSDLLTAGNQAGTSGQPAPHIPAGSDRDLSSSKYYGIIYDMMMTFTRCGRTPFFIPVPAIYLPAVPLNTKIEELAGLLSVIIKFNPVETAKQVLGKISAHEDFSAVLSGNLFKGHFDPPDAYRFETDPARARSMFRSFNENPGMCGYKFD